MNHEIYPEPTCACGALLDQGKTNCRKCRSRDRWLRRRAAARRKDGEGRGEIRRPPRAPRGRDAAGVSWT
ncbi:hypothetical protein E1286_41945 [Nonomuraea terrae]|uniref:Uncharacterized protein n=1 Tax=Nonomuraea terrae TaxID=2530383 RepID=A0A4R4XRT1_9ACTN|nr:hypothetical protein [Nonomuraea terrae]TDD33619.1 hypothetical protein E1286_41945 [Nonomuraea terrae]